MTQRLTFLEWCSEQLGKPYLWDAKGPEAFDCSGFVTFGWLMAGGPDWRLTHNSQRLHDVLEPTSAPQPGDAVFYGSGPTNIHHVMIWYGDGRVIGASGGDHRTTSIEIALKQNAKVKLRSSKDYRPDFVSFGRAPLDLASAANSQPDRPVGGGG